MIQRLDTNIVIIIKNYHNRNIVIMSAESLNLWFVKFIQRKPAKVSEDNTLHYGVLSSCVFTNCTIKIWQLKRWLTVLFDHYLVVKMK